MSRRGRAIVFVVAALFAAVAAAAIADGYGDSVARGYGELRPVVVARDALRAGRPIDSGTARVRLELRRVPARVRAPGRAGESRRKRSGLAPAAPIPAGSYLLARSCARRGEAGAPELGGGRHAGRDRGQRRRGAAARGRRTGRRKGRRAWSRPNPAAGGSGRTYVAAAAVPLLALGAGAEGDRGRRDRGGDPGADPSPGPAPDRRRELRPPGDAPCRGLRNGRPRAEHRRAGGAGCAARLVERRRADGGCGTARSAAS